MDSVFQKLTHVRTAKASLVQETTETSKQFRETCLSGDALTYARKLHPLVQLIQGKRKRKEPEASPPPEQGTSTGPPEKDEDDTEVDITMREATEGAPEHKQAMSVLDTLGSLPTDLQWPMIQQLLDHRRLFEGIPSYSHYEWLGVGPKDEEEHLGNYRLDWTDLYLVRIEENARHLMTLFNVFRRTSGIRRVLITPRFREEMYRNWYRTPLLMPADEQTRRSDDDVGGYPIPPPKVPRKTGEEKQQKSDTVLDITWYRTFLYDVLVAHYLYGAYTAAMRIAIIPLGSRDILHLTRDNLGVLASPPTVMTRLAPRTGLMYIPPTWRPLSTYLSTRPNIAYTTLKWVIQQTPYWHPGIFDNFEPDIQLLLPNRYPGQVEDSLMNLWNNRRETALTRVNPLPPVVSYYRLIRRAFGGGSVVRLPSFIIYGLKNTNTSRILQKVLNKRTVSKTRDIIMALDGRLLIHDEYMMSPVIHRGMEQLHYGTFPVPHETPIDMELKDTFLSNKASTEEWFGRIFDSAQATRRRDALSRITLINVYHRIGDPSQANPDTFVPKGNREKTVLDGTLVLVLEQYVKGVARKDVFHTVHGRVETHKDAPFGWIAITDIQILSQLDVGDRDGEA